MPELPKKTQNIAPFANGRRAVWFLAAKDVAKDRRMAALVVTILAVSYVNLVFFASFMNGLTNTFQDQLIDLMTSHVIISPKENVNYIDGVSAIQRKVDLIPGVVASAPRITEGGTVSYRSKTRAVPIVGVTPSKETDVTILAEKIFDGEFLSDSDTGYVLLGRNIAERAGEMGEEGIDAGVGTKVRVSYSNGVVRDYIVKGIIFGNFWGSDESVYVTTKEIESVYSMKDQASSILVRINDKEKSEDYKNFVLAENVGGTVKTWDEFAGFIKSIKESMGMMTTITTFVGLLVAAMTMAVIIFINTTNKRRQIGILKAIGAKDSVILRIYLIESAIFGILGIIAGIAFGYGITYYFNMYPFDMPMGLVRPVLDNERIITASLSLLFAVVAAGFYPAWKAANENILKAIQGE